MGKEIDSSYTAVFHEVGQQIRLRKQALFIRSLLIAFPIIIVVPYFTYLYSSPSLEVMTESGGLKPLLNGLLVAAVVLFYASAIIIYTAIEKRVWLDSYFDKKNLTSRGSKRVALKLLPQVFVLGLRIFFRYILPPIILLFAVWVALASIRENINGYLYIFLFLLPVALLVTYYKLFLPIKLRFLWFLFLDTYQSRRLSYWKIFRVMKLLNKAGRNEQVLKALSYKVGADITQNIVDVILNQMAMGFSGFGKTGGVLGKIAQGMAGTYSKQLLSYAQLTANYILYREARQSVYTEPQAVNISLYDLAGS